MKSKVLIVTGGNSDFFRFIEAALSSLEACGCSRDADLAVLDQGLAPSEAAQLIARGYRVAKPNTTVSVHKPMEVHVPAGGYRVARTHAARHGQQSVPNFTTLGGAGLLPRTELRDHFPGYDVYVWFDGDAWAQTSEFFHEFVEGARVHGIAVALENGNGYRHSFADTKWWLGNLALAYGPRRAMHLATKPWLNAGVFAIRSNSSHWINWRRYYIDILERTGKHLDQHAFFGAIHIEGGDVKWVPSYCNWICLLSAPRWDSNAGLMCEPRIGGRVLSVLHLAGPEKERSYDIMTSQGQLLRTPLTYDAVKQLTCTGAQARHGS
jgi:hypothetical protein